MKIHLLRFLKVISILLISSFIVFSCKLPKVIESSQKEKPNWVYGIKKDYIIVEGVGLTWDQAQDNAIKKLKERIISSVAVNITSETNMEISETVINNMSQYSENTEVVTNISSDFFNTLKGISLNKSESFYWEKQKYPGKINKVHYHIMYPFSNKELEKLIVEWEKTDKGFVEELNSIEEKISKTSNITDLLLLLDKVRALKEIFTGTRKTRVSMLESEILHHLENLKFEIQSHERGQLRIKLLADDRYFEMNPKIDLGSPCAEIQDNKLVDNNFEMEINYDADFCYSEDKSHINLTQIYGDYQVEAKITIPVNENSVRLTVNEPIRLKKSPNNNYNSIWHIPLRVYTDKAFTVTKVELSVKHESKLKIRDLIGGEDKESYVSKEIEQSFTGKGDVSLKFDVSNYGNSMFDDVLDVFVNESSIFKGSGKLYLIPEGEETEIIIEFENKKIIRID